MKPLWDLDDPTNLQEFVTQELKNLGIKVPRTKKVKSQEQPCSESVFGNYLCYLPCVPIENCGHVPRFLVTAVEFIEQYIDTEGLFRKSGSVSRQKELKQQIENDNPFTDVQVFDITGLVKQFFRELPDPLLTNKYHDTFIKCYQLSDRNLAASSILDLCLLLPGEHLGTLRYMMKFLARVADSSDINKMDAGNLAVVLGPNIMHVNTNKTEKMNASEEKLLQTQTAIVEFLIRNAHKVGIVSTSLLDRLELMEGLQTSGNSAEINSELSVESETRKSKRKKKRRSSSLQGFVSNIAQSLSKWRTTPVKANNMSQLSGTSNSSTENIPACQSASLPVITPLRKRKASGEAIAFSATKKKAILMNMPQTPFTPSCSSVRSLPPEIQKALEKGTPIINFSKENEVEFTATPDKKKASRKRLSLFSPSSARKSKSWSVVTSSSNVKHPVTKEKKKGLFRRLSGGKSKVDSPSSGKQPLHKMVGERLASPAKALGKADSKEHINKSGKSAVLRESPISALVTNAHTVTVKLEDDTERFLSPSKPNEPEGKLITHIERPNMKLRLRTKSVEIRRGKPNTVANGLKNGDVPVTLKVRRDSLRRKCSRSRSLHTTSRHLIIENSYIARSSSSRSFRRSQSKLLRNENARRSFNKSDISHNVILSPPAEFADSSAIAKKRNESPSDVMSATHNEDSDSDQSEAGFSTISGDTVIFVPSKNTTMAKECGNQSITRAVNEAEERAKGLCKSEDHVRPSPIGGPDPVQGQGKTHSGSHRKFSSTENLRSPSAPDSTIIRSQSMYERMGERAGKTHHAVPNLVVSADMRSLLARAGYVKEVEKINRERNDVENSMCSKEASVERAPIKRAEVNVTPHDSVVDLKAKTCGSVSEKAKTLAEKQDLDRHNSPLRFPNSTTRTRGASPVRIPTIFAKGDKEAERFRQIAISSLRGDSGPVRKGSANLPISTQLIRPSAEATRCSQALAKEGKVSCHRKPSIYKVRTDSSSASTRNAEKHGKNDLQKNSSRDTSVMPSEAISGLLEGTIGEDSVFNVTPHPAGDFTDAANNSMSVVDLSGIAGQSIHVGSPLLPSSRFTLSASLQDTINNVCTPLSEKLAKQEDRVSKTPLQERNHADVEVKPQITPHIRKALLGKSWHGRGSLRTPSGMTPRHLMMKVSGSPGAHARSPVKPVKRLGSPRSVYKTSPHKAVPTCMGKPMGTVTDSSTLSCIPPYLQNGVGDNL